MILILRTLCSKVTARATTSRSSLRVASSSGARMGNFTSARSFAILSLLPVIGILQGGPIRGPLSDPQKIVDLAIDAHGGQKYRRARIEFDFRESHVTVERKGGLFSYEREFRDNGALVHDVLTNEGFYREVDGERVTLTGEDLKRQRNSLNSIAYFFLIPFGLNDDAVRKRFLGEIVVKSEPYYKIQVTFDEEGGGDNPHVVFVYWIHQRTFTVDYLAYRFNDKRDGSRFREAYQVRTIEGIRFADYINYKANDNTTPLADYNRLFEQGNLSEISRIINENVTVALIEEF